MMKREEAVERSKRDLAVMKNKADRVYGASVVRADMIPQRWKHLEMQTAETSALPIVEAAATAVPHAWSQHGVIPPLKPMDEAQAAALRREFELNVNRKARRLNGLSAEHAKNETEIDRIVFADLRKASAQTEVKVAQRIEKREKNFVKRRNAETHRLLDILDEDQVGRDAARKKESERDRFAGYKPPSMRDHL